jgi:hypothetical protein
LPEAACPMGPLPDVPPCRGEVFAADAGSGTGACGGAPDAMVKTGSAGFSARGRIRWARKGGSGSMARLVGTSGNSLAVISVVSVGADT